MKWIVLGFLLMNLLLLLGVFGALLNTLSNQGRRSKGKPIEKSTQPGQPGRGEEKFLVKVGDGDTR